MSDDPLRAARAEVLSVLRGRAHGPWLASEVDGVCEQIPNGAVAVTQLQERGEVFADQYRNLRVRLTSRSPLWPGSVPMRTER